MTRAFKVGNQFWRARSKHGRNKIFSTPGDLWEACCEYFKWIEDNPLIAIEPIKHRGVGSLQEVPKMHAMTIGGLCIFLGVTPGTWDNYRKHPDYKETCTSVETIIYQQKLSGAAADLLNQNIIARELGLKDKQERKVKTDSTVATAALDPEKYAEVRKKMLEEDDC